MPAPAVKSPTTIVVKLRLERFPVPVPPVPFAKFVPVLVDGEGKLSAWREDPAVPALSRRLRHFLLCVHPIATITLLPKEETHLLLSNYGAGWRSAFFRHFD